MMRLLAALLALAVLASAPGCVTRKVKKALEKDTEASITVEGDQEVLVTITHELSRLYKVDAKLETLETGVKILRLIGAYDEVIEAITWMLRQSLRLLANDEVTETLLQVAIAAMK